MNRRRVVFIDTTPNSQALQFRENPLFNSWLQSFNNIPAALTFIQQNPSPYATDVYLAKDNILDDGLPEPLNGRMRTLIRTLDELQSIKHITVFTSDKPTDISVEIRCILSTQRTLEDVIPTDNLECHMCRKRMGYLQQSIDDYIDTEEAHLIDNILRDITDLHEHMGRLINNLRQRVDPILETHSNRPGQQPS